MYGQLGSPVILTSPEMGIRGRLDWIKLSASTPHFGGVIAATF